MPDNRNYMALLKARWQAGQFVCVGLDSDVAKLPPAVAGDQLAFNRRIIAATQDLAAAYKPNLAFYRGDEGKKVLRETIRYIRTHAPDVPVILDAKYGDIGNTNDGYVDEAFGYFDADAVTVHNYLGLEAMKPFLDCADKGIIVLCRTSNPGAGELQDRMVEVPMENAISWGLHRHATRTEPVVWHKGTPYMPHYQYVAYRVAHGWNYNFNCSLVVGATYPQELAFVRAIIGEMPVLLPGIGKQDGDLDAAVTNGVNARGNGFLVNNSRGLIFASNGSDFGDAAQAVAVQMNQDIAAALAA